MPRKKNNNKKKYTKKHKKEIISSSGDKEVTFTGHPKTDTVLYKGVGVPQSFVTKLKYNERILFNGSAMNTWYYRANGPYDPRFSLGGGQPMWYDQLSALYSRYCVLASSIQATFINNNTTITPATRVGIFPDTVTTNPPLDIEAAVERDNCTYATCGSPSGDQGIINMISYAKIHKMLGLKANEKQDDTLCGLTAVAPPTREAFWCVFLGTLNTATVTDMYMDVTITYYVKFFSRIDPGRS